MYQTGVPSNPRRRLYGLGVAALVCAAYLAGRGSRPSAVVSAGGPRPVLYYVDPMHPSYRSERPGKAPDCGMDLEPVYAGAEPPQPAPMAAGSVRLTPEQEQAARLQTETVEAAPASRTVRTAGRVAPDEGRTYRISAGVDGWVRRVFSDRTGYHVKRGEALAAFYSKDISAPQQAYVYALESYERSRGTSLLPPNPWLSLRSNSRRRAITSNSSAWVPHKWKSSAAPAARSSISISLRPPMARSWSAMWRSASAS